MQVTAAVVTCGGLCPGLNDVVAGIVNKLSRCDRFWPCVHLLVLHKLDSRARAMPAHMPEIHPCVCSYGVPDGKILGIRYGFR